MRGYDVENQSFGLGDLVEDSDEGETGGKRTSFDEEVAGANGRAGGSMRVKREIIRSGARGAER